jgi:hypothetical protein
MPDLLEKLHMESRYATADANLARLKGWEDVTIETGDGGEYRIYGRLNRSSTYEEVPLWTQDPAAVMRLMVEHNVWPHGSGVHIHVQGAEYYDAICAERVDDHGNDGQRTIRFALVRAATLTIEAQLASQARTPEAAPTPRAIALAPESTAPAAGPYRPLSTRARTRQYVESDAYAQYYDRLIDREMRLAELLGWTDMQMIITSDARQTIVEGVPPDGGPKTKVSKWTRDPADAFSLISETGCSPVRDGAFVRVTGNGRGIAVRVDDHPATAHAMQLAAVEGAIKKLDLEQIQQQRRNTSPSFD